MKKLYDKYKKLQDALKSIIIRSKEIPEYNGNELGVIIDINGEMKVKEATIHDPAGLLPEGVRQHLEKCMKIAFEKGQQKAQDIAQEKSKEILGFDPSQIASMMGGGAGGMPNIPGLS